MRMICAETCALAQVFGGLPPVVPERAAGAVKTSWGRARTDAQSMHKGCTGHASAAAIQGGPKETALARDPVRFAVPVLAFAV